MDKPVLKPASSNDDLHPYSTQIEMKAKSLHIHRLLNASTTPFLRVSPFDSLPFTMGRVRVGLPQIPTLTAKIYPTFTPTPTRLCHAPLAVSLRFMHERLELRPKMKEPAVCRLF